MPHTKLCGATDGQMTAGFGSYMGLMYPPRMSGRFKYDHRYTVRFGSFRHRLSRSELHRNVPEKNVSNNVKSDW